MSFANWHDQARLEPEVDAVGRQAVERLLRDGVCDSVDYRRSTPSTNSLALADLAESNFTSLVETKLFVADQQTAGRGRHGRSWISTDSVLTFTLAVPRAGSQGHIIQIAPLAVGVGIAEFLEFEFAPLQVRLKWPNDVHVGGGKVAGILIETTSACPERMVIGVGINVGDAPDLGSQSENHSARGIAQVLGRTLQRYDLLAGIVTHMLGSLALAQLHADQVLDAFRKRCLLTGQSISFQDGDQRRQGRCQGISDHGALLVHTGDGVRSLHSGEANLIRARA